MKGKVFLFGLSLLVIPVFFAYQKNVPKVNIIEKKITWGFKTTAKRSVDAVIIHSTYNATGTDSFNIDGVLEQFKTYGVGAHYLIDRDGKIYRLIDEENIAFHAGVSSLPDGRANVNTTSMGIEIITTIHTTPTEKQYESAAQLVKDIKSRRDIKYVMGHSEIAPGRKTDPWNFNWKTFNSLLD